MSYAVAADIYARYGRDAATRLTDRDSPRRNEPDEAVINAAIAEAEGEIDSYLAGRYELPIANPPAILKSRAVAMAWAKLHISVPNDNAENEAEIARRWLRDITAGRATLGLNAAGNETPADSDIAAVPMDGADGSGTFTKEQMRGFGETI